MDLRKRFKLKRLGSLVLALGMLFTNIAPPLTQVSAIVQENDISVEEAIQEQYDVLDDRLLTESDEQELKEELNPAGHDPASHVTETDAGDAVENEDSEINVPSSDSKSHETDKHLVDEKELETTDLTNLDEFILDPIIESHIINNYDEGLVTIDEDAMSLIGVLPVRSTIFDETVLGNYRTLASIATDDDVWFESFLSMFMTTVPLYELSQDNDYFVAFTDTLFNDPDVRVLDYVFAISNLDGEVVQAHLDVSTGIAYIPKSLLVNEVTDTLYIGEIQLQLMQGIRSSDPDIDSSLETLVDADLTKRADTVDEYAHDVVIAPANAFETTVEIDFGLKANDITVFVNGFEYSNFDYDAQTGVVTIPQDSASIISLRVAVADDNKLDQELIEQISSFTSDFETIQPRKADFNIADVELNSNFASSGVMTFNSQFRYFHDGNNPFGNNGHLLWYGPDYNAHATPIINDILNGGVNYGNLEVSDLQSGLMPIVLNLGTGSNSPFTNISNIHSDFAGLNNNQVSILLACATVHVPVLDSMGSTTTVTPGVESRGNVGVRARIVRQESDRVFIGFVTGNTYGGTSGQAGYGVLMFGLEDDPMGSMGIQKQSAGDPAYVNNNPLFSLQGARYGVWSTQAGAATMNADTRLWTMTTNSNGWAQRDEVELGTYFVREMTPSAGHALDPNIHRVTITANNHETRQVINSLQPVPNDPPFMRLQKMDADGTPNAQGGGTLGGARYTVRYFAGTRATGTPVRTWVYETNAQGIINFLDPSFLVSELSDAIFPGVLLPITFPLGTITVQETRAPVGYLIDPTVFVGHIEQHPTNHAQATFRWANGTNGALMAYNASDGMTHQEQAIRGGIRIEKWDIENQTIRPQGDATLQGAEFAIYNRSDNAVIVDGMLRAPNERVGTLTTNAQGVATSSADWLPYGAFEAIEIKAPNGYLNTGAIRRTFNIRENGVIVNLNTANTSIQNDVIRGGVEIEKADRELTLLELLGHWTGLRPVQGDASLVGIEFEIVNDSPNPVRVDGQLIASGEVIKSIFTDYEIRGGAIRVFASTAIDALPYGTFTIQEIATNDTYLLTDGEARRFEIREDLVMVTGDIDGDELLFLNYVVRGDVEIEKHDIELNVSEAMAGTSLEDIEFEITNESNNPVLVGGHVFAPNETIMSIFSFWCDEQEAYVARTTGRTLPVGTYRVTEVRGNTYYLTEQELGRPKVSFTFEIREDGSTVRHDTNNNEMIFYNQVRRGDLSGVKIAENTAERLSHIPFAITNNASGETNVVVTDMNGEFNTHHTWNSRLPENVNINNHVLEVEANGELIMNSDLDFNASIWFATGEFGSTAPVDPVLGALPYGWYTFREMRAENNLDYELLDIQVFVSRHGHLINMGTLTNINDQEQIPEEVSIATQAHTGDGSTQKFTWGEEINMHDDIEITHTNIPMGTSRAFRAYLFAVLPEGAKLPESIDTSIVSEVDNSVLIFMTGYQEYEVIADVMNKSVDTIIDTSNYPVGTRFFWAETAYNQVNEDADNPDEMWEEDDRHNFDGKDENQTLTPITEEPSVLPEEVSIATQAHTGDGSTQEFIWGEEVNMHDNIEITHTNIPTGTTRAFRAYLFAVLPNGAKLPASIDASIVAEVNNSVLIYMTDYQEYEVIADLMNKSINTMVDTSEFPAETRFFWAETAYHQVCEDLEDETGVDEKCVWEEDSRHNFDGKDENQTLSPVVLEIVPTRPKLPDTGATVRATALIGIGLLSIATTIIVVEKRKKLSKLTSIFTNAKKKNK